MYIVKKERKNKRNENVYYFYLAESKRVDGKVKNKQTYMTNFKSNELEDSELMKRKIETLIEKFTNEEIGYLLDKLSQLNEALYA